MKKFSVAFSGLIQAFCDPSVRIQVGFGLVAIIAGVFFRFTSSEWMILLLCIGSVISAEIFNTCIEKICDFIQPNLDDRIKTIKDMASGAVLFVALVSLIIGCILVMNHI